MTEAANDLDALIAGLNNPIFTPMKAGTSCIIRSTASGVAEVDIERARAASALSAMKTALEPFAAQARVKGRTPEAEHLREFITAMWERAPQGKALELLSEFLTACLNARAVLSGAALSGTTAPDCWDRTRVGFERTVPAVKVSEAEIDAAMATLLEGTAIFRSQMTEALRAAACVRAALNPKDAKA